MRIMKDFGIVIQSEFVNAIGVLLFFLPIVALLLYLSNDMRIMRPWKIVLRLLVIHICLPYIAEMFASWFV